MRFLHHSLSIAILATRRQSLSLLGWLVAVMVPLSLPLNAADEPASSADSEFAEPRFSIRHYKIVGAKTLPRIDVESAVYPFMGPSCGSAEIEKARAALEKSYQDAGYKTVTVSIPLQDPSKGSIKLEVTEGRVQRVRVRGARYFDPDKILSRSTSLSHGSVPNFNEVTRQIIALNRHPDREVRPDIKPTGQPGEFDVDLVVKDKRPLHGSVELNNRYTADTTPLRLNLAASYANLWQAGHTIGVSAQVAPERLDDALVYSGYYIAPLHESGVNLMLTGTKQDSDISTLGGAAVQGKGYILGAKVNFPLPGYSSWQHPEGKSAADPIWTPANFFHSLSVGVDFKHFDEDLTLGETRRSTPIEYFPVSLGYGAGWVQKNHATDLNVAFTLGSRGLGSDSREFDNKRYRATGGFFKVAGDLSHTRDLANDAQLFGKVQGQWSGEPLVSNEQFAGGGLGNARGYLESTSLGDNAVFATLEVRSPNLLNRKSKAKAPDTPEEEAKKREWRVHGFVDAGALSLNDPLPEQTDYSELLSVGVGSRFQLGDALQGSVDAGFPLRKAGPTDVGDWRVSFRLWTNF